MNIVEFIDYKDECNAHLRRHRLKRKLAVVSVCFTTLVMSVVIGSVVAVSPVCAIGIVALFAAGAWGFHFLSTRH